MGSRKISGGVDVGAGGMGYTPAWWNCVLWIISNNGRFFFLVLLFYNNIMFVKVMNVIIFHSVHTFYKAV